jgi:hypothetical protein
MPEIKIAKINDFPTAEFKVTVIDNIATVHLVTLTWEYYQKLTAGNSSPEDLIKKSLEFLLDHEPNTSILSKFSLNIISNYFPQYEKEIIQKINSKNQ